VLGFLEMTDPPEKVASTRSGRCDRQRKRFKRVLRQQKIARILVNEAVFNPFKTFQLAS
jgi:hypothetical protein